MLPRQSYTTPVLILLGEDDLNLRVPPTQGRGLTYHVLKGKGQVAGMLAFPKEVHPVDNVECRSRLGGTAFGRLLRRNVKVRVEVGLCTERNCSYILRLDNFGKLLARDFEFKQVSHLHNLWSSNDNPYLQLGSWGTDGGQVMFSYSSIPALT